MQCESATCWWLSAPLPCVRCAYSSHSREALLLHMLNEHSLAVARQEQLSVLHTYLDTWRQWLLARGDTLLGTVVHRDAVQAADLQLASQLPLLTAQGVHQHPDTFLLLGGMTSEDEQLRIQLNRQHLEQALECQQRGRRQRYDPPRPCFFCNSPQASPYAFIDHLFAEHHLNLGRPDNLVHIDALLRYLEAQVLRNQCLYCHKTFEDRLKFKNHLRKKQHYRLNAADKDYDAFFIVYYANPGTPWQELDAGANEPKSQPGDGHAVAQAEEDDEDDDDDGEHWQGQAACPFCLANRTLPDSMFEHWRSDHGFDFDRLCQQHRLSFYDSVRLIHLIRREADQLRCAFCGTEGFSSRDNLAGQHFRAGGCPHLGQLPAGDESWRADDSLLQPTSDAELLLIYLDREEEEDEEERQGAGRDRPGAGSEQPPPDGGRRVDARLSAAS